MSLHKKAAIAATCKRTLRQHNTEPNQFGQELSWTLGRTLFSLTPHPTPHWAVQQHKTPVTRTPGAGAMASHHPPPIRCRSATIINTFTFYAMKGSLGVVEGPEGTVWDRRRSYPEGRCVWRVCWNRGLRNSQPVRFS